MPYFAFNPLFEPNTCDEYLRRKENRCKWIYVSREWSIRSLAHDVIICCNGSERYRELSKLDRAIILSWKKKTH